MRFIGIVACIALVANLVVVVIALIDNGNSWMIINLALAVVMVYLFASDR